MKKTLLTLGFIILLFTITNVANAQILSPIARLEGSVDSDTKVFFIGKTTVSGIFQGYSVDTLVETSLLGEINAIPLFGSSNLENIDSVMIIEIEDIETQSLEDIIALSYDDISSFSNVNIIADSGPFMLGGSEGTIELESELEYTVSTVLNFEMTQDNPLPFLILLTSSEIKTKHNGELSLLTPLSETCEIVIEDSAGNVLWNDETTNKFFLIDDESFFATQNSPIYLFPLISKENEENIKLSISPSESTSINITYILDSLSSSASSFGEADISQLTENIEGFESYIEIASSILNGGMLLIGTDDTFTIDDTQQTFSSFGFARGNEFDVTISSDNQDILINGDCKLIFLGDHMYSSRAKESENGFTFPFEFVVIWIIAIFLYFFFKFYLKKETNEVLDKKIKKYALIFHIAALIAAFILLDREISYQFGTSAIDILLGQGVSLIILPFVAIELIMWVLGFLIFAIPIRMITMSGLKMVGVGKGGKGIGKGVGNLSIWIFCAFYVKLFINLVFLIINPANMLPIG